MRQDELFAIGAASLVLLLLCCGGAAVVFFRKGEAAKVEPQQVRQEARPAGGAARRLAAGARRRRQARQAEEEQDEEDVDEQEEPEHVQPSFKAARKDAYEEKRRKRDEQREAQALAEEQEALRKEEELRQAEDAEAAKWLGQISVSKEGNEATEDAEQQGLLNAFIDYIKEQKTVILEDLAAHFGLRVQDVINRVQNLESMGQITGVMDDRGKFIYISLEEMKAVADFIQRKGRVSVAELAAKSNTFIDLDEKATNIGIESIDLDNLESMENDLKGS